LGIVEKASRVEVNGSTATADDLALALVNHGHFTSMQVRGGRVRRVDLHLDRLKAATAELYAAQLDTDNVRAHLRHGIRDVAAASVKITIFQPQPELAPTVMVSVSAAREMPSAPQRLQSVQFRRPFAHLKHVGTFAQIEYAKRAQRDGFDDALFIGADETIAETTIANIGFLDGHTVVWPDAPSLHGTTMQLLDAEFLRTGIVRERRAVRLGDIESYSGAFLANSIGVVPVAGIDSIVLPIPRALMDIVASAYDAAPWEVV
jgi:branched-subunit amino acid aminotransferase/4-amino-4-deoxychorismate lyase